MAPKEQNGSEEESVSIKLPQWLKAELFEDILRKNVPGYKQINNFKAHRGVAAGENYITMMLRVEIDVDLEGGKVRTVPFVMKIAHENEVFKKMMEDHNIFQIESDMYSEVVPELEQMYREAGKYVKFGAQSFKLPTSENYVLLEDLKPRGFSNINRLEGLDMRHTKSILKKLAEFHAASAVRVAIKGKYADSISLGWFLDSQKRIFNEFQESMGRIYLQCMKRYKRHEEYIDKVEKLQNQLIDKFFELGVVDDNEFNVLNHGDCWSNNIMFKHDAFGRIQETYFVDLQMPKYGSPAQDLIYFLISSTQYDIKLKKFDQFVKYYHDNLIENLVLLKYPKKLPTLKDIHIALIKYGLWGYNTSTGVLAAVLCEPTETASIDNFLSDTDDANKFKVFMYTNSRYVKHIEAILPWLNNRGAFEV